MLDQGVTQAFCDELNKIAAAYKARTLDELEGKLKPGDILTTETREPKNWRQALDKMVLTLFQGTPYTHTGLYVGDGKIVDAGEWSVGGKTLTKVHEVPLKTFAKRYKIKALRVKAPDNIKQDAVAFAKKQVGKDFNMSGVFRLGLPILGKPDKEDRLRNEVAKEFFCSELVANAYANTNIAKDRALKHVRPVDIQKSPLTRSVAVFH